jgi:hypothetical protein
MVDTLGYAFSRSHVCTHIEETALQPRPESAEWLPTKRLVFWFWSLFSLQNQDGFYPLCSQNWRGLSPVHYWRSTGADWCVSTPRWIARGLLTQFQGGSNVGLPGRLQA